LDKVISIIKLRVLVTLRSYTKSTQSRVESYFFFPLFIMAMLAFYRIVPHTLSMALDYIPAPVMVFNLFFFSLAVLWIMIPFMGFRLNESLDIKRLIHYPITFPTLFTSLSISNFLDISNIVPLTIMAAFIKFEFLFGNHEGILGIILLCIVVFIFLQSIYQTVILILYNLLPGFNPLKLAALVLLAVVGLVVLINLNVIKMPSELVLLDDENLSFHNYLPTGIFAISAYEFHAGNLSLGYAFLVKSALILIPVIVFNFVATYLTYRSVEQGIIRSHARGRKRLKNKPCRKSLLDNFKRNPVMAIASKDAQTFFRDWHFMFYKMMPGIITPVLILLIIRYSLVGSDLSISPELQMMIQISFIILVMILFLAQSYIFVGNIFGYDRAAVSSMFTAPVTDRQILLGKNIFMFFLLSIDSLVISILIGLFFPGISYPLSFFSFMECLVMILVGLGNISSMIFPYYVPMDKPTVSFQGTLIVGLMNMITVMALSVLIIPVVLMLYYSLTSGSPIWLFFAIIASILYSLMIYGYLLFAGEKLLPRYRESIYQNVSSQ